MKPTKYGEMSMEQQRERFDKWATINGFDASENMHRKYRDGKVFWMWEAWKESAKTCTELSQICAGSEDMHKGDDI